MKPAGASPMLVVLIGVAFTSLSAILVRLSVAPPLAIASWRMVFATAMVVPFVVARQGRAQPRTASRTVTWLSIGAGILLAGHFGFWITSLSMTSVASSTVLVTTHPVIVALLGLLLGERIRKRSAAYMVGALAGGLFLVRGGLSDGGSAPLGNLFAFLGAVAFAGYLILGRIARRHLDVNRYTLAVYSTAAVVLAGAAAIGGDRLVPYPAREFAIFLSLAFFCTLLGHSLFNWALRFVKPTTISTSVLAEPVIATTLALVVFSEVPTTATIVGGAVMLACILLFIREES